MPIQVVRNDITKMRTDAIVDTANAHPIVGPGCDSAIYKAAGYNELLEYRKANIGVKEEGEAFITPAFNLPCKYIIHTVSPLFIDGKHGEEEKLRKCYQNCLKLAKENNIKSISFPLIATGSFMFPKKQGIRFAMDEINDFLLDEDMEVYIVVYDNISTDLARKLYPDFKSYLEDNYVPKQSTLSNVPNEDLRLLRKEESETYKEASFSNEELNNRLFNIDDTFSTKLFDLIDEKGFKHPEVYKRADIDKRAFNKIKNDSDYHPNKYTALKLCVGAKLTMPEAIDLLNSAGYCFSNSDVVDAVFAFFIEKGVYDIMKIKEELDNQGVLPKDQFRS